MIIYDFYQIIGQVIFIAGIVIILLLSLSLILGKILIRQNRLIFPKLLLFTLDIFYGPFKKFSENLGLEEKIVDQIGVEVRNKVNKKAFENSKPEERLLILPHCLRNADCEAKLDSSGLKCTDCNRCVIGPLKKKGENMGYKVFIIPGSTFLKKIAEKNKFKAVLGVACYQDLNLAMMKLSKFSCQGVPLLKDGCINTKVDYNEVLEKMGAVEPKKKIRGVSCNPEPNKKNYI